MTLKGTVKATVGCRCVYWRVLLSPLKGAVDDTERSRRVQCRLSKSTLIGAVEGTAVWQRGHGWMPLDTLKGAVVYMEGCRWWHWNVAARINSKPMYHVFGIHFCNIRIRPRWIRVIIICSLPLLPDQLRCWTAEQYRASAGELWELRLSTCRYRKIGKNSNSYTRIPLSYINSLEVDLTVFPALDNFIVLLSRAW